MIVATRYSGNREVRSVFGVDTARVGLSPYSGWVSLAGEVVTDEAAVGLTAVGRALRLVAGSIAAQKIRVYEGRLGEKREVQNTDQALVLSQPVLGVSDFDWLYDIAVSLEACENAYLQKRKDRNGVVRELPVIPAQYVSAYLDRDGRKVFEVGQDKYGPDTILHIRGQTINGGPFGVSRIYQHRDPLGAQLAAQRFEGAYFQNSARPDLVVVYPHGVSKKQHDEWAADWDSTHGGPANAGKPHALGGGADIKTIPISMRDAQFVEARRLGVEEVGRIMDVDAALLGAEGDVDARKTALELFLRLQLTPRLRRIERALKADPDLFGATDAYPEFQQDDLMFTDALTKAQVRHQQIQDGTLLVDEARAAEGRPPLPDGMGQIPQVVPVGGAPNPDMQPPVEDERQTVRIPAVELRVEQDTRPLAEMVDRALHRVLDAHDKREQIRDEEDSEREERARQREDALEQAHAEALRQVGSPNIVVNVDPTPVTVTNEVKVEPVPVTMTMEMPMEHDKQITFERTPNGQIKGAKVEAA